MTGSAKPQRKPAQRKAALLYRGVKLQSPAVQSHFTIAQIKKAVDDAIAKNADAIASVR